MLSTRAGEGGGGGGHGGKRKKKNRVFEGGHRRVTTWLIFSAD
jgi:hypothetical protein